MSELPYRADAAFKAAVTQLVRHSEVAVYSASKLKIEDEPAVIQVVGDIDRYKARQLDGEYFLQRLKELTHALRHSLYSLGRLKAVIDHYYGAEILSHPFLYTRVTEEHVERAAGTLGRATVRAMMFVLTDIVSAAKLYQYVDTGHAPMLDFSELFVQKEEAPSKLASAPKPQTKAASTAQVVAANHTLKIDAVHDAPDFMEFPTTTFTVSMKGSAEQIKAMELLLVRIQNSFEAGVDIGADPNLIARQIILSLA